MNLEELGWEPFFEKHFEPYREKGFSPARIAVKQGNVYVAYSEIGELTGKVTGRYRYEARSQGDFPTVGDWVAVKGNLNTGKMTIHGLLPRKSSFSRKGVSNLGRVTEEQVISANIDTVFLVMGLDQDFSIRRLERYLVLAQGSGAQLVVVLNKADLCENIAKCMREVEAVVTNVPIHAVCALDRGGLNPLLQYLGTGQTIALVGSSGVGKSTLVNTLIGEERQIVGPVRGDGRGRHITAKRELVILPGGGLFIDNPGMRSVTLWGGEKELDATFEDIKELARQCKFKDRCQHRTEPGCAIKQALEDGTLDRERWQSYLKLQRELRVLAMRKERRARVR
ncbi:MAG: ribosome small subunit-dependent GTPase A [Theionarchaea archaeon]|nr:ribosome small subunit-dependent GTPase A [Theionarchaea archaeon]